MTISYSASYLSYEEAVDYGLTNPTENQIDQASRLIDAYCRRWTGFVFATDATGQPAYMPAANPDLVWYTTASIAQGSNVVVSVVGPPVVPEMIGRPVVLDRGNPSVCEACVITDANNPTLGTFTLGKVNFAHTGSPSAPLALESGLHVFEERYLPQDRSISRVAQWPVQRVVSGLGRYSYGRRSQQVSGNFSEFNLLAILQHFGGPPTWIPFDVNQLGINPLTGELWIPAGLLLAYYSDCRVYYVAGWSQQNLPQAIKAACANVVRNYISLASTPMLSTLMKSTKAGDSAVERFANESIDDETKRLLNPYRATLLF